MTESDKNTLHYKENTIVSAHPEDLTLMMYNGLMKFIARAQDEIRAKSFEAAHNTLLRCQDIVFEFQYTLNMDYSVSNNLMLLYDYLYNRLIEANAKKDCAILDESLEFVTEMRDTWVEAVKLYKEKKVEIKDAAIAEALHAEDGRADDMNAGGGRGEGEGGDDDGGANEDGGFGNDDGSGGNNDVDGDIDGIINANTGAAADGNAGRAAVATAAQNSRAKTIYKISAAQKQLSVLADAQTAKASVQAQPGTHGAAASLHAQAQADDEADTANLAAVGIATGKPAVSRANLSAAAQYAKISKSKNTPQEIISIASK